MCFKSSGTLQKESQDEDRGKELQYQNNDGEQRRKKRRSKTEEMEENLIDGGRRRGGECFSCSAYYNWLVVTSVGFDLVKLSYVRSAVFQFPNPNLKNSQVPLSQSVSV